MYQRYAKPGKYKIEVNFFGSRQQTVAGATALQVKLTTGFATGQGPKRDFKIEKSFSNGVCWGSLSLSRKPRCLAKFSRIHYVSLNLVIRVP